MIQTRKMYPPNYPEIVKAFPFIKGRHNIVFAWSGIIYNPSGHPLDPDVIAHEETHFWQQRRDPEGWWAEYIANPRKRLEWEIEAYRRQITYAKEHYSSKRTAALADRCIKSLSSPMYGNLCTKDEARVWLLA